MSGLVYVFRHSAVCRLLNQRVPGNGAMAFDASNSLENKASLEKKKKES